MEKIEKEEFLQAGQLLYRGAKWLSAPCFFEQEKKKKKVSKKKWQVDKPTKERGNQFTELTNKVMESRKENKKFKINHFF